MGGGKKKSGGSPHGKTITQLLTRYPEIELDNKAKTALEDASFDRAEEILEEIDGQGHEIRNASAFICKALKDFPFKRGGKGAEPSPPSPEEKKRNKVVRKALQQYPDVANELDEGVTQKLMEVDPDRAVEIIREVAAKDDVRNVSAFVFQALRHFPRKRGARDEDEGLERKRGARKRGASADGRLSRTSETHKMEALRTVPHSENWWEDSPKTPSRERPRGARMRSKSAERAPRITKRAQHETTDESLVQVLADHPRTASQIDDSALDLLKQCQPARAVEIITDVVAKKGEVRNVSAFVAKAVYVSKIVREFSHEHSWKDLEILFSQHPRIAKALDDTAMQKLKECEITRSLEVMQDLVYKDDVKNPSAFVTNALMKFPCKRMQVPSSLATRGRARERGRSETRAKSTGAETRAKSTDTMGTMDRAKKMTKGMLPPPPPGAAPPAPDSPGSHYTYTQINVVNYSNYQYPVLPPTSLPASLRNGSADNAVATSLKALDNAGPQIRSASPSDNEGINGQENGAKIDVSAARRVVDVLSGSSQGAEHFKHRGILWRAAVLRLRAALEACTNIPQPDPGVEILGPEALRQGVELRAQDMAGVLFKDIFSDELVDLCVSDEVLAQVFAELELSKAFGAPNSKAARADEVRRTAGQLAMHTDRAKEADEAFGALCGFVLLLGCSLWSLKTKYHKVWDIRATG